MKRSIISILLFTIFCFIPSLAFAQKETLIIFDQSASMYEVFEDSSKFYYAKKAVNEILNNLNDSDYIGLRTIGINPEKMRLNRIVTIQTLCTATQLLNEVSQYNKSNIQNSVKGIIPSGTSPIEYVLATAINKDFSTNAEQKHIILVTDGYENCNGDPCGYIRRLMSSRNDIKIDIVAIGVGMEDANALQCLTNATNGKFINIQTPSEMNNIIKNINDTTTNWQHYSAPPIENIIHEEKPKQIQYKTYLLEFFE